MVHYCCVPLCKNTHAINGISLHSFPKDPALFRVWQQVIRRDEKKCAQLTKYSKVCSAHFKSTDYLISNFLKRKSLKTQAVPSIFAWTPVNKQRRHLNRSDTVPMQDKSKDSATTSVMDCNNTLPKSVKVESTLTPAQSAQIAKKAIVLVKKIQDDTVTPPERTERPDIQNGASQVEDTTSKKSTSHSESVSSSIRTLSHQRLSAANPLAMESVSSPEMTEDATPDVSAAKRIKLSPVTVKEETDCEPGDPGFEFVHLLGLPEKIHTVKVEEPDEDIDIKHEPIGIEEPEEQPMEIEQEPLPQKIEPENSDIQTQPFEEVLLLSPDLEANSTDNGPPSAPNVNSHPITPSVQKDLKLSSGIQTHSNGPPVSNVTRGPILKPSVKKLLFYTSHLDTHSTDPSPPNLNSISVPITPRLKEVLNLSSELRVNTSKMGHPSIPNVTPIRVPITPSLEEGLNLASELQANTTKLGHPSIPNVVPVKVPITPSLEDVSNLSSDVQASKTAIGCSSIPNVAPTCDDSTIPISSTTIVVDEPKIIKKLFENLAKFEKDYRNHVIEHTSECSTKFKTPHNYCYFCPFCFYIFSDSLSFLRHMGFESSTKVSSRLLDMHKISIHCECFPCIFCSTIYDSVLNYQKHIVDVDHDFVQHICSFCDLKSIFLCALNRHHNDMHEPMSEHHCRLCNMHFLNNVTFKVHKKLCRRDMYYCVTCDHYFMTPMDSDDHVYKNKSHTVIKVDPSGIIQSLPISVKLPNTPRDSESSMNVQDKSDSATNVQDKSESSMDVQDKSESSTNVQDKSESSIDVQDKSESSMDVQDKSESSMDVQDKSESSTNVQEKSESSMNCHTPLITTVTTTSDNSEKTIETIQTTMNQSQNSGELLSQFFGDLFSKFESLNCIKNELMVASFYVCPYCCMVFITEVGFLFHIGVVITNKKSVTYTKAHRLPLKIDRLICAHCETEVLSHNLNSYHSHLNAKHLQPPTSKYQCGKDCKARFAYICQLNKHKMSCEKYGLFVSCNNCKATFQNILAFWSHEKRCKKFNNFCVSCKQLFPTNFKFKNHQCNKQGQNPTCVLMPIVPQDETKSQSISDFLKCTKCASTSVCPALKKLHSKFVVRK